MQGGPTETASRSSRGGLGGTRASTGKVFASPAGMAEDQVTWPPAAIRCAVEVESAG